MGLAAVHTSLARSCNWSFSWILPAPHLGAVIASAVEKMLASIERSVIWVNKIDCPCRLTSSDCDLSKFWLRGKGFASFCDVQLCLCLALWWCPCCASLSCSISITLHSVEACITCFFRACSVVWILSTGPTCYQFSKLCESMMWAGYELCTVGYWGAEDIHVPWHSALVSGSVMHGGVPSFLFGSIHTPTPGKKPHHRIQMNWMEL